MKYFIKKHNVFARGLPVHSVGKRISANRHEDRVRGMTPKRAQLASETWRKGPSSSRNVFEMRACTEVLRTASHSGPPPSTSPEPISISSELPLLLPRARINQLLFQTQDRLCHETKWVNCSFPTAKVALQHGPRVLPQEPPLPPEPQKYNTPSRDRSVETFNRQVAVR